MTIEEREKELKMKEEAFMDSMKGRTMGEIMEHPESKRLDEERKALAEERRMELLPRTRMLTVRKLMDYLATQDPDACVLAYEANSLAYIEQLPTLPNESICTVAEMKAREENHLRGWYKGCEDAEERIREDIKTIFRYSKDNDVIIGF